MTVNRKRQQAMVDKGWENEGTEGFRYSSKVNPATLPSLSLPYVPGQPEADKQKPLEDIYILRGAKEIHLCRLAF